ncbi:MAG: SIR2 family protein [archaeon]|nr:SIR2 family protein [archaeon]
MTVYEKPKPWLVHVGGTRDTRSIQWFVEGVVTFLAHALQDLSKHAIPFNRSRPLICVPFVGAGFGGAADRVGELINALFDAAEIVIRNANCDIGFITNQHIHYAAAQSVRQKRQSSFASIPPRLRTKANELARMATDGQLALFVGAGVSMGCGLPSWNQLLEHLATAAGLSDEERTWLSQMSFLDQARILEKRLGGGTEMQTIVAERIGTEHFAISHALLANLPVCEYITTNYDLHLERALHNASRPYRVIPYSSAKATREPTFVLKLHGCVLHPQGLTKFIPLFPFGFSLSEILTAHFLVCFLGLQTLS